MSDLGDALKTTIDEGAGAGLSLDDLSRESPVLVLFLRHSGCTFCREAMADLAKQRARIEAEGVRIVLVHMSSGSFAPTPELADVGRIGDPDRRLYKAFGLKRGSLWQLVGPKVIRRGVGALARHGVGRLDGDGLQMPGLFLLKNGRIEAAVRHKTAADQPDYAATACGVA